MTAATTDMTTSQEAGRREPMAVRSGDLALLQHPVAQELLQATLPARLAYIARDGTPRVVPMQFHWTGQEIVLSCWPDDPKVAALRAHPRVALTIDTAEPPFRVLQVRGAATVEIVDGVSPELAAASLRYMGPEEGQGWVDLVTRLSPQTARIAVHPDWVEVLDFATRFPSGLTRRLGAPTTENREA